MVIFTAFLEVQKYTSNLGTTAKLGKNWG